ncbi:MAG: M48 family metalloprotease [Fimbriiglobus sp.]
MTRWTHACFASAVTAIGAGCLDEHTVREWTDPVGTPVKTPEVSEASLDVAARVDQVGRELVAASPFLGVDPTFHTAGIREPFLGHPDPNGLVVSEGLVKKCKSDAELAAVLASELGKMAAEKQTAGRLRKPEPPPPLPTPGGDNNQFEGISSDMNQLAERANFEKKFGKPAERAELAADARQTAAEVLRAAGYRESALAAVEPLLKEAAANRKVAPTFAPKPPPPRWSP